MSQERARRPIVIRRKKVVHGHHGGSWKIALADFMTALMALFLVMWILSSSSREERQGVAEYFRTPLTTAISTGERQSTSSNVIPGGGPDPTSTEGERARIDLNTETRPSETRERFMNLKQRIETAVAADPVLRTLRNQLRFEMTPEGLRILLVDTEQRPMFELGSDQVASYMRRLLRTLAPLLNEMPNQLSISGHTDSLPYSGGQRGYSNWELSSDRANASRRELVAGGLNADKMLRVAGMSDRVAMADTEAGDAANRRIELIVLNQRVVARIRARSGSGEEVGLPPSPLASRLADSRQATPVDAFVDGMSTELSDG